MRRAYSLLNVKEVDEAGDEYIITGVASTPKVDRMGDIVEPNGARFKLPMPLLWQHQAHKPVGRVEFASPTKDGIPYRAHLPKVKESGALRDRIEEAVQSIKYRLVMAVSIGFDILEDGYEVMKNGGLLIKSWEWLELSLVTIPANADATVLGVKSLNDPQARERLLEHLKSIDTQQLAALGHKPPPDVRPSPGASGQTSGAPSGALSHSRSQKGKDTMNTKEMIEARATKNARLKELIDARSAESRAFTDEEGAEFDALTDEVKALDDDIRVAKYHATNSAAANPVDTKRYNGGQPPAFFVRKEDPDDKFKGQAFTRTLIAKALAFMEMRQGNFVTPAQIAEARWGKTHPKLVAYMKAAVTGAGTGSGEWGAELATADTRYTGDFIEFLYGSTIYDRLGLRSVPGRVHIKGQDGAATGYWVGESKAIPVSKADYSDVELSPLKVGAIAVCSKEWVRDSSPSAEMLIRDAIVQASSQRIDATFLSATAASAGVSPAGLLNGVTAVTNSGGDADALRADFQELVAPFITNKNSTGLQIVTTPSLAMAIGMLVNALGQPEFPGLSENGGVLFNKPVLTGDNVGPGDLILLKPSDIWRIDDRGVEVSMTDQATIEQDGAPQGATDTPVASSATVVSLWQTESIGFKVVRSINFQKRRTHAVQFIGDAAYGVAAGLSTE